MSRNRSTLLAVMAALLTATTGAAFSPALADPGLHDHHHHHPQQPASQPASPDAQDDASDSNESDAAGEPAPAPYDGSEAEPADSADDDGNGDTSAKAKKPYSGANRAPQIDPIQTYAEKSGEDVQITISASDPDGDTLTLAVTGLPPGAGLTTTPQSTDGDGVSHVTGTINWKPGDNQFGTYQMVATVSDGHSTVSQPFTQEIDEEWESYLTPGLQYSGWFPSEASTIGDYNGLSFEFLVFAWSHRNQNRGPSHGRIYMDIDLLKSTNASYPVLLAYSGGFDLSFERNPQRRFLIPYFGLEFGGMHEAILGNLVDAVPLLGVHLFVNRNIFVNLSAGYFVTGRDVEKLQGPRIKLGLNFSLW